MSLTDYFLFTMAAISQISTPRPSTIFLVGNTLKHIPSRVILTHTGSLLAAAVLASFSLLGVSSLLLRNPESLTPLKFAGAIYILWLGLNLTLSIKSNQASNTQQVIYERISVLWGRSFMAEIIKPKRIIFFSALLPQFVESSQILQTGSLFPLIVLFIFIKLLIDSIYVLMATKAARKLAEPSVINWSKRASGSALMLIGIATGISAIK